jgi:AcrR family transcriptional regulator
MFDHSHPDAASTPLAVTSLTRPDPRSRLCAAMIQTVAARGYDRTTVSRVLSSADLQEAVFREHFHDKHDCFMRAADELIGNVERAALEQFEQSVPWPHQVRLGLLNLLRALAQRPDGARVVFVEMLGVSSAACRRQRTALALFTSLMEQGRSCAPHPEQLPEHTSEAIVGGIASIVHRRVLQGETLGLPALHADLTYFALLPYLDHERALAVAMDTVEP